MNEQRESENFAYFDEHRPEPKIELLDGRLLVGNGLAGSRLLLDHILRGWSVDAAVALGSIDQWIEAICLAYHLSRPGQIDDEALQVLEEKVRRIDYVATDFTRGEEGDDAGHWSVRSHLESSLYRASHGLEGSALGRDFVMRLGEDGFTPDAIFFKSRNLNTLHEYYLEGPAELVIEVTRPAHRHYDSRLKPKHYARAGVPEYLMVDPEKKEAEFLRLVSGKYIRQQPDGDGLYRPQSIPGLAIAAQHLWADDGTRQTTNPFIVEKSQPPAGRMRRTDNGLGWGERPFEPRLALDPVKLRFEEYICWCPEAKFEFWDGKVQICGDEGVRNLVGMLLMTLGMLEVCRYAPPSEWIAALKRRRELETRNGQLRQEWREKAIQAASLLRSKYHPGRIAITGDLLSPRPLNYWSRLRLAVWDLPPQELPPIYNDLSQIDIDLIEGNRKFFQRRLSKGEEALEEIR